MSEGLERRGAGGGRRPVRENGLIVAVATVAVVALTAALTHFSAVLLLPEVASKDAVSLLAARNKPNTMTLLTGATGGDLIPFADPATVRGACLFDLTKAPLRVRAKTEEGRLLTLSFRAADGRIFYSMTDRSALHGSIDIRLVTADQLKVIEAADSEDAPLPSELRLQAPTAKGLLLATALVARPSEARDAAERIGAVSCASEPIVVATAAPER